MISVLLFLCLVLQAQATEVSAVMALKKRSARKSQVELARTGAQDDFCRTLRWSPVPPAKGSQAERGTYA
jgi:hypothetical protein